MTLGFHKKRRILARIILTCMLMSVTVPFTVFAEGLTVNDLVGGNTTTVQSVDNTSGTAGSTANEVATPGNTSSTGTTSGGSTQSNYESTGSGQVSTGSNNYADLAEAGKVDLNNPKAKQATSGLKNIVGIIVTFLCYAITILLTLRVIIDLLYIAIPFTRSFLCAAPPQGSSPGGMGGMGMGGGYGGMGGGYGGMGGYGMNRGYGGMGGMGAGGMGAQGAGNGTGIGGIQWCSKAAMNAVANEGQPNPRTGKETSAIVLYAKDMVVLLVAVPILIILASNGALISMGLKLGEAITGIIAKISGSI